MALPARLYLASFGQQNGIYIADLQNSPSQLFFPLPESCWDLQIAQDQKTVFAASMCSGNIFVVDVFNGGNPITITTSSTIVFGILLHPNQKFLYAATDNGVWCVDLQTQIAQLLFGKGQPYKGLDIDEEGTTLFGLGGKQVFRCNLQGVADPVYSAAITPTQLNGYNYANPYDTKYDAPNKLLWVCYCGAQSSGEATNQILVFTSDTLQYVKSITVGVNPCKLVLPSFSKLLGVLCFDSTLWLIDTRTASPSAQFNPNPASFAQYGFSPWCVSAGGNTLYIPNYGYGCYLTFDLASQSFSGPFPVPYQKQANSNELTYAGVGAFPQPLIVEISAGCTIGQQITITGAGFCEWAQSLKVMFSGDVVAIPTSATLTSLSVEVPAGAVSGPVVVAINGLASTPSNPITIVAPGSEPSIASFFPANALPGMWLGIKGSNFTAGGKVNFAGAVSAVFDERSTSTEVYVRVPVGAQSGSLSVTCQGITSTPSSAKLQVLTTPIIVINPNSGS